MTLDLREVVGVPGQSVSFDYAPDLSELLSDSVVGIVGEPHAYGYVRNSAGLLTFHAELEASISCECSRCLKIFERDVSREITAPLSESESAADDPEYYYLESTALDPDEIIVTEMIMDAEQNPLCKEDCLGLCAICGSDLNKGECSCRPEIDPRLAVLSQLFDEGQLPDDQQ